MNCEEKNNFSGFFIALAIQINQRKELLLNTNLHVKHKKYIPIKYFLFEYKL